MDKTIKKSELDLQARMDNVQIPDEIQEKIAAKETGKTIRGTILGALQLDFLEKIFDTSENIENETNEYKKGLLMSAYMSQVDDVQKEIQKLENFVTSPEGNVLFSKIVRIINNNPQNKGYSKLLADCLRKIIDSNFKELFNQHIYSLNQIDKLTPQALILLADYGSWPEYKIDNYASNHGVITSEWIEEFLLYYAPLKNIDDDQMIRRISHALKELLRNGFIQSKMQNETDSKDFGSVKEAQSPAMCEPTELGREILDYVDPTA